MKITKQARRDAKALFRSCLQEGQLNEDKVRQVCKVVLEKKPRSYIAILSHLQHLVKLDIQNRTARIESAVARATADSILVVRFWMSSLTRCWRCEWMAM